MADTKKTNFKIVDIADEVFRELGGALYNFYSSYIFLVTDEYYCVK